MSDEGTAGTTRREVLVAVPAAALSLAGLVGCSDDAPAPQPAPVDPDVALREAAAQRERALLQAYDAALQALPDRGPRLLVVREHHATHLALLLGPPSGAGSASPAAASPAPASGAASAPTSAAPAPAAPRPPADVLAGLSAQERAAGEAHAAGCLQASRRLAGLLASLSASERSHPVALR